MDRTGRWVITAGGIGVILSVLGIFSFCFDGVLSPVFEAERVQGAYL